MCKPKYILRKRETIGNFRKVLSKKNKNEIHSGSTQNGWISGMLQNLMEMRNSYFCINHQN